MKIEDNSKKSKELTLADVKVGDTFRCSKLPTREPGSVLLYAYNVIVDLGFPGHTWPIKELTIPLNKCPVEELVNAKVVIE